VPSAEIDLAAAFRAAGTLFLRFYRMALVGEDREEAFDQIEIAVVTSVAELAGLLREKGPLLRSQETEQVHDGHPHLSLRQEVETIATGAELTTLKMQQLGQSIPAFEESETLAPLAPLRDLLRDVGNKLLVISSTFEEIDQVAQLPRPDAVHLVRTEDRLAKLLEELGELMRLAREKISIAVIELHLSTKKRPT
jgi:hypothetical protein